MARPSKEGLDYWQAGIGMWSDDKFVMTIAKHGDAAISVIVRLLDSLFNVGYCYRWKERDRIIFASKGTTPLNKINEIVADLVEDGFFDAGMLERCSILTSKGIQRRYVQWCRERTKVVMKREHLLINVASYNNVEVIPADNPGFSTENPSYSPDNPSFSPRNGGFSAQSRVEKHTVDQRRVEKSARARDSLPIWNKFLPGTERESAAYQELLAYCEGDVEYLEKNLIRASRRIELRKRGPHKDAIGYMREWLNRERNEYGYSPAKGKAKIEPINVTSAPSIEDAEASVRKLRGAGLAQFKARICELHPAVGAVVRDIGPARFFAGHLEAHMETFRERYTQFIGQATEASA